MPHMGHGSHYFAATCFILSGLITGLLLAGGFAISVVLFGAVVIGGFLGFYLSRGQN
jgi:hypothetical protein